jgi:hypothetical protein
MTEQSRNLPLPRAPFFIVGFSRSGTTLFAALLDNHSQMCVTPETRFCRGVFPCGQPDKRPRDHDFLVERVFGYWRIKDLHVDKSDYEVLFKNGVASYRNAFASLLECYRLSSGKPLVGEKSPIHLFYVDTLLDWFPEAHIYCLIRDGRDVVNSMMRAPFTHAHLPRHAAEWAAQSGITRRLQSRFPGSFEVIRFEDLVQEPKKTMIAVCRQLGEEFENAQLEPVSSSAVVPDWEKAWKENAMTGVDASKVELWRSAFKPKELLFLNEVMGSELDYWGYDTSPGYDLRRATVAMIRLSGIPFKGWCYRFFRALSECIRVLLCRMRVKAYK